MFLWTSYLSVIDEQPSNDDDDDVADRLCQ